MQDVFHQWNYQGLLVLVLSTILTMAIFFWFNRITKTNAIYLCISEDKIQIASLVDSRRKMVCDGNFSRGPVHIVADIESLEQLIRGAIRQCVVNQTWPNLNRIIATSKRDLCSGDRAAYHHILDRLSKDFVIVDDYIKYGEAKPYLKSTKRRRMDALS